MSAEVHQIPDKLEEPSVICEVCAEWEVLAAHWLIYHDGTFRCVNCGTAYEWVD